MPEVESRTQGSRPRPRIKKSEAKAKDSASEDRPSRGQGQKCSRTMPKTKDTDASALQKKGLQNFFSGILQKKGFKIIFSGNLQNKRSSKQFFRRSTKFSQFKKYCCPRAENRAIFEDLRLQSQGLDLQGQGQGLQDVYPRTSSSQGRPRVLHLW